MTGYRDPVARSNRVYDTRRFGQPQIRVYHRRGTGRKMPRYLLKCGCCEQKLEIYYADDGLEIGGVNGALADWRQLLEPLLRRRRQSNRNRGAECRKRTRPAKRS